MVQGLNKDSLIKDTFAYRPQSTHSQTGRHLKTDLNDGC